MLSIYLHPAVSFLQSCFVSMSLLAAPISSVVIPANAVPLSESGFSTQITGKSAKTVPKVKKLAPLTTQPQQAIEPVAVSTPTPVVVTPPPAQITGTPADWMAQAGIDPSDYGYVDYIVGHEGGWSGTQRYNTGGSGAYGLCQALPGGKMASAGDDWATNPVTQLRWCSSYAAGRYGGWAGAYHAWISQNWW